MFSQSSGILGESTPHQKKMIFFKVYHVYDIFQDMAFDQTNSKSTLWSLFFLLEYKVKKFARIVNFCKLGIRFVDLRYAHKFVWTFELLRPIWAQILIFQMHCWTDLVYLFLFDLKWVLWMFWGWVQKFCDTEATWDSVFFPRDIFFGARDIFGKSARDMKKVPVKFFVKINLAVLNFSKISDF